MAGVTYVVTGAAVVLRTLSKAGGGEQYLYKGAPIVDGVYRQESLKHAEEIGLIQAVAEPEPEPEPEPTPAPAPAPAPTGTPAPAPTPAKSTGKTGA